MVVGLLRTGRKPERHREKQKLNTRKTIKLACFISSDAKKEA